MKVCPLCRLQFEDSMFFCLEDGTPLRSPSDANLDQTLAISTNEEKTLALTARSEETAAAFPEPSTGDGSVETDAQFRLTARPKPIPLFDEPTPSFENVVITTVPGSADSRGRLKFIVLGGLLGVFTLVGSMYVGWRLSQASPADAPLNESNKQMANSDASSNFPNDNASESSGEIISNAAAANSVPTPFVDLSTTTPSVSPVQDKSKDPTPDSTPTPNTTPKTPEPTATKTPTPSPTATRKPPDVVNMGVLNRKAAILYQPKYPPAARSAGAGGTVNVQVLVNENGKVVDARAVSGHPLLRATSEDAARSAIFEPLKVDGQRVKMRGMLVYKFVP